MGCSSQFPQIEEGGGPTGNELGDELMCDIDTDLEADDKAGSCPSTSRHRSHKLRFPPCLDRAKVYTGEIDDNIYDTHLLHDLKRHPSTQARKG